MARCHLRDGRAAGRVHAHGVGRPAVHAVDQENLGDPQVVVGARFDEYLLDRAHVGVASRLGERDRRSLVRQHVDPVVRRPRDPLAVVGLEADAVEALVAYGEGAAERAFRAGFHADRVARVHHHQGAGRDDRGRHSDLDPRPGEGRNVAAVLETARREARVAREVVHHFQAVDRRKVGDADGEGPGAHAVRLDVVSRLVGDVQQESLPGPRTVFDHGRGHEAVRALFARVKHDIVGREAVQRGRDHEIGVARDGRVAGRHRDAVRVDGLRRAVREEERGHAVAKKSRTEEEDGDRRQREPAERPGRASNGLALDPAAVVDAPALAHGALDHFLEQRGAFEVISVPGGLHRGQDAGLQGRLVFFQVQGHALVGNATEQRPEDRANEEEGDDQPQDDPERGDRFRTESQKLQGGCRNQEGHEGARQGQGQAPQQELEPPAAADPPHDPENAVPGAPVLGYGHLSPLQSVPESVTTPTLPPVGAGPARLPPLL